MRYFHLRGMRVFSWASRKPDSQSTLEYAISIKTHGNVLCIRRDTQFGRCLESHRVQIRTCVRTYVSRDTKSQLDYEGSISGRIEGSPTGHGARTVAYPSTVFPLRSSFVAWNEIWSNDDHFVSSPAIHFRRQRGDSHGSVCCQLPFFQKFLPILDDNILSSSKGIFFVIASSYATT